METPAKSKVCIFCHQVLTSGKAARVKDDPVINSIRGVKKLFHVSQNNELFVCEKDLQNHAEKRTKFEKDMLLFSGLAVVIFLVLTVLPIFSGRFQVSMFLSSVFIGFLIILFGVILKYAPAVEPPAVEPPTVPPPLSRSATATSAVVSVPTSATTVIGQQKEEKKEGKRGKRAKLKSQKNETKK